MENKKIRGATEKQSVTRTTIILPRVLDQNIEVLCSIEGKQKGEVIATALKQFLEKKGLQPDKTPKNVSVIY